MMNGWQHSFKKEHPNMPFTRRDLPKNKLGSSLIGMGFKSKHHQQFPCVCHYYCCRWQRRSNHMLQVSWPSRCTCSLSGHSRWRRSTCWKRCARGSALAQCTRTRRRAFWRYWFWKRIFVDAVNDQTTGSQLELWCNSVAF